jgi:hypothetical protein
MMTRGMLVQTTVILVALVVAICGVARTTVQLWRGE